MKTRLLTGIVLLLFFVPPFVIGGWYLNVVLMLLSMGATYELFRLYNTNQKLPIHIGILYVLLSGVLYFTIAAYFMIQLPLEWGFFGVSLTLLVGGLLLVLFDEFGSDRIGQMLFAVLYPSIAFGAIYGLREQDVLNIGFLFLITVSTDIFAYIVGVNFGKHRLAVKISPKKSIEGSIGGTLAAVLFTMIYLIALDVETVADLPLNIVWSILLIIFISVVAQIGDLVASKLKRSQNVKDFSNLFPGHGGILDRFDSVLFAGLILMMISKVVELL